MIKTFNASFYKNGYLLIIAAWLYTISFIFSNYFSYSSSPARVQKQLETYIKNSEEAFGKFTTDTPVIAEITNKALVPKKSRQYLSDDIGLFVYTPDASGNLIIRFWSNNKMLPDIKDLSKPDGKYFSRKLSGQFEFVKKTVYVQNKQVVAAALIPLHWSYFFSNEYLRSEFQAVKGIEKKYKIADTAAEFYIKNGDGKVLFGLKQNKSSASESPGVLSLLFRVLALVLALIYLNMYSLEIVHKKGWIKGFIFLACCVFVLRFLSYHYPFPFEFRNLEFFAATVYASNSLHPSLGDLFINIILLFWLISFLKEVGSEYFKNAKNITGTSGWLMTVILSLSLIALSFIAAGVIRSLIIDSRIPFDVTNFFSLNFYSLCSFIILCFIILTFFHLSHFALLFIYKSTGVPVYAKYLIVTIAGLVYLSFHLNNPVSSGNLVVLFWLLLYMGVMEFRREDIFVPILRSSFFLVWIIFFTASISALIVHENQFVELDQRKRLAQRIITRVDPQAETLLSLEIADINNDFLSSNFARLGYENTNKIIKDSLINANFSGYLTTYDTRLYTFDRNYQPLYNDDPASFENITNIVYNRSRKTRVEDLYYFANEFRGFSYLYQKKILDSAENVQGYFFVVAEPKKYNSQALMPELFKQVNNVESDLDVNYAYAVYSKGEIINNYGDYNFRSFIPKNRYPRQEFIEENKGDVTELWYNAGNSRLVVIVKVGSVFFQAITL
ncbi:MAG TPA: hypothetical protein VF610_13250, partial [Segetibacter sp.]